MQGIIKFWNSDKGFGFIKPDSASEDEVFVPARAIDHAAEAAKGVKVSYDVRSSERDGRPQACDVKIIN
jgi:CspA family cold shock protein